MDKFINNQEFMVELFDDVEQAERAGEIGRAILEARSLRLTDIAAKRADQLGDPLEYARQSTQILC